GSCLPSTWWATTCGTPSTRARIRAEFARPRFLRVLPRPRVSAPLTDRHVPEQGCRELQYALDVSSEGRRHVPLAPRHIRHLVEGDLLNLGGEQFALDRIPRSYPFRDQPFELRNVGPPGPSALPGARNREVHRRADHVRRRKESVENVPATLGWRLLTLPHDQAGRPVHFPELDFEADGLEALTRHLRSACEEGIVDLLNDDHRPTVVARITHELPRLVEVVLHDWLGPSVRGIGAATGIDGVAGSVVLGLADGQVKIGHLVHHVEQRLARLLVVERRMQVIRAQPALDSQGLDDSGPQGGVLLDLRNELDRWIFPPVNLTGCEGIRPPVVCGSVTADTLC